MILNEETGNKVLSLINTKGNYNYIAYCGCWSANCVRFEISRRENNELKAGFVVNVTNDFKIVGVERLRGLEARNIYGGVKNSGYKKVFDSFNYPLV